MGGVVAGHNTLLEGEDFDDDLGEFLFLYYILFFLLFFKYLLFLGFFNVYHL